MFAQEQNIRQIICRKKEELHPHNTIQVKNKMKG